MLQLGFDITLLHLYPLVFKQKKRWKSSTVQNLEIRKPQSADVRSQ